jgi:hypothetical protein
MVSETKDNPITWQFLVLLAGLIGAFVTGAIWLGANSNQIEVNSKRIERLEIFMDEVRSHDSNTTARLPPIEHRLEQLENWQQAVKRNDH